MAMSEREKTFMKATLALACLFVVYLLLRRQFGSGAGNVDYNIEGSTIGGGGDIIVNEAGVLTPGQMNNFFNSDNNVNVNTIGINELSQKYIPMFGLVGMTSVGNIVYNQPAKEQQQAPTPKVPEIVYNTATKTPPYVGSISAAMVSGDPARIAAAIAYDQATNLGRNNNSRIQSQVDRRY